MQKASEIIGRSVVVRDGALQAGKIKDIVVDPSGRQVLGFVLSEGLFKSAKVVPWAGLQAIGPDSVVVDAATSIVKAAEAPELEAVLEKELVIRGVRLQTTAGKDLGRIEDLRFDERSGAVLGYELAGGVFERNSYMPAPQSLELGKELAFVGTEAEETIEKM